MKSLSGLFFMSCALLGCTVVTPVQVRSAPQSTGQQLATVRALRTRVIATPLSAVFPKVLDVLMDSGYLVRSANETLGIISFYQQWQDTDQSGASISEEGTAVFRSAGPSSTEVRLILTGGWQRVESSGGGVRNFSTSALVGGVQQHADPREYKKVLDLLEKGLSSTSQ
ncbi:MAG: hypothetical protein ACXVCH_17455 [Bdellovibrionota bacterium]